MIYFGLLCLFSCPHDRQFNQCYTYIIYTSFFLTLFHLWSWNIFIAVKISIKNQANKFIGRIFHGASAQKTLPSTAKIKLRTCDVLPHGSIVFYVYFFFSDRERANKLCKFFVCFQTWHPKLDAIEYKFMEIFAHQFGYLLLPFYPYTPKCQSPIPETHTAIWGRGSWCWQTPLASLNLPPRVTNTWQSLLSTYLNRINFCGGMQVNIRSDKLELHLSQGGAYRLQNVV